MINKATVNPAKMLAYCWIDRAFFAVATGQFGSALVATSGDDAIAPARMDVW